MHTASLVHDDLIDGAELRRGAPDRLARARGARRHATAGDYLFARAFAELADAGDLDGVRILAETCLSLSRGEALQRQQLHDPDTPIDEYIRRCTLKSGRLFEAACLLGSRDDAPRRVRPRARRRVPDRRRHPRLPGDTIETGKIAGTDLREGTPTLPLLLAAREDEVVREALAGGPLEGALVRVGRDRRDRAFARGRARIREAGARELAPRRAASWRR